MLGNLPLMMPPLCALNPSLPACGHSLCGSHFYFPSVLLYSFSNHFLFHFCPHLTHYLHSCQIDIVEHSSTYAYPSLKPFWSFPCPQDKGPHISRPSTVGSCLLFRGHLEAILSLVPLASHSSFLPHGLDPGSLIFLECSSSHPFSC